jgi:predicted nucleic acid-binding Zn ribbon protein
MPRTRDEPDEEDDWDESEEYDAYRDYDPEDSETYPEGIYNDDGPPLVNCPYCNEEIAEDSQRCPECGNYLSKEDAPPAERKSFTWMVLVVLVLLIVAFWIVGG